MQRLYNVLASVSSRMFYVALVGTYFLGLFHAFNKHSTLDGVAAIALPPWTIYRGLEYWWHDDHADVNWKQRMESDMYALTNYLASSDSLSDLRDQVESFSKEIASYPDDKRVFLERGGSWAIKAYEGVGHDFLANLRRLYSASQKEDTTGYALINGSYAYSVETRRALDTLAIVYGLPELREIVDSFPNKRTKAEWHMAAVYGKFDSEYQQELTGLQAKRGAMIRVYRIIFGHEPIAQL